jgi:hypothetical protein
MKMRKKQMESRSYQGWQNRERATRKADWTLYLAAAKDPLKLKRFWSRRLHIPPALRVRILPYIESRQLVFEDLVRHQINPHMVMDILLYNVWDPKPEMHRVLEGVIGRDVPKVLRAIERLANVMQRHRPSINQFLDTPRLWHPTWELDDPPSMRDLLEELENWMLFFKPLTAAPTKNRLRNAFGLPSRTGGLKERENMAMLRLFELFRAGSNNKASEDQCYLWIAELMSRDPKKPLNPLAIKKRLCGITERLEARKHNDPVLSVLLANVSKRIATDGNIQRLKNTA